MLFITDQQTLDDLGIFGRQHGESVFGIYNRAQTRGGAAELELMFRHPLARAESIGRRSGIIQFFAGAGIAFPFTAARLDEAAAYLSNNDERSKLLATESTIGSKLTRLVARDGASEQAYNGVSALVEILGTAEAFLRKLALPPEHPYHEESATMLGILGHEELQPVLAHLGKRLSYEAAAGFDHLLRFRLRWNIEDLLRGISRLDVYISVGAIARERGYAFPVAIAGEAPFVDIRGVYHPLVKNAVPNDVSIEADGNVLFLTGANMAGKSTFMKTLSIALFVAHTGFPVAAEAMAFTVLDGMFTTINLPDNLGQGASHFYAEVMRVKKMALELAAGKRLFILFDELFRGTNVKDAHDATVAIVAGFAKQRNSIFLISTHIVEAGPVLQQRCRNVRFLYLPTLMEGHRPVYPYKLEQGITGDRHGMVIIHNEGILDMLRSGLAQSNGK